MLSSSLGWKSGPSISASSLFGLCCSRGCCLTIIVNTGRNKPPAETRTSVFTEKLLLSFPLWVLLRPSSFYSVFDAVKILGVTKTHTHKKNSDVHETAKIELTFNMSWKITAHRRRVWLCCAVRNLIIWVENGKCRRLVQLGWNQVTEAAWLIVDAALIVINLTDQSRPIFSLSALQSGLESFSTGWRMIIQCYVVFIHVRLALRGTSGLPGKSDLTALMLFESFGCTSVSLFWQLSTISRFSSAFWVFFFWVQTEVSGGAAKCPAEREEITFVTHQNKLVSGVNEARLYSCESRFWFYLRS